MGQLPKHVSTDPDESAAFLTGKLRRLEPFLYIRFGDGFLECLSGRPGKTCDGEEYSPALAKELLAIWLSVIHAPNVYLGDWMGASFDRATAHTKYETEWRALLGMAQPEYLHFEALLLMRESPELLNFYRVLRSDPRKKLYVGPSAEAAAMLGAQHYRTPMSKLYSHIHAMREDLLTRDFDVLVWGAGMAGNIPVVRCWQQYPERTYIHLGSALDPLFLGRTRKQQITSARARVFLRELF